jgi:hypothetical protein
MTSFIHIDQSADHSGIDRANAAFNHVRNVGISFNGSRGLAALLLAAMVSALLVVADRVISSWSDGGLLVGWIALWAVAFVALALLSESTRALATRVSSAWRVSARRRAIDRQDQQLWRVAQSDSRVMADIEAAISRASDVAPGQVGAQALRQMTANVPSMYEASRRDRIAKYY